MTTTNDTTGAKMTSQEVVKLIPEILATAQRFDDRAQASVAYHDLLGEVDTLLSAVRMFADDDFSALKPTVVSGAREMEGVSPGFAAMGRVMQLQLLIDHPEILQQAVTRAEDELSRALHRGTLPARFRRGESEKGEASAE